MRALAAAVGVSAPGLYRYVASRDELVGHMVDLVSADLEHPPPSGDWVHDITVVAERQRALFRAHPWLAEAVASLRFMGRHVLDHLDWGLAVLADVDAPNNRKMEAIALANGIAALFSTTSRPVGPDAFAELDSRRHPRPFPPPPPPGRPGRLRRTRPPPAPPPGGAPRLGSPDAAVGRPLLARPGRCPARRADDATKCRTFVSALTSTIPAPSSVA